MPEFTEERRLIQDSAREFTKNVVRPLGPIGLTPSKARFLAELVEADGRTRLFRHPHSRRIWRPRPWRVRVLSRCRRNWRADG